ncbi:MAG: FAD:protein FMN transferase [Gemmatimonadetes bacterium]|nr:FAD:protein FMN transferase [Gemmatimonadota bacterium]
MASPCEILIEDRDSRRASALLETVSREAWRIEAKFSRYREDSVVQRINRSGGEPLELDPETARLLDFAARCHELSGGAFDVTSGVLRRAWRFDGSDRVPDAARVEELLPLIGWHRVGWTSPRLVLPAGMEIDLGGVGKEYAVDRALELARAGTREPVLVNFGGDLAVSGARRDGRPWRVGIESLKHAENADRELELSSGALATSGDANRFLLRNGVRYSHVLDPRTGWPVPDAPRSVTVLAGNCTEAGLLATLALLQGAGAEEFLREQGVSSWCLR